MSVRVTFVTFSEPLIRREGVIFPYALFFLSLPPAVLQMVKSLSVECLNEDDGEQRPQSTHSGHGV